MRVRSKAGSSGRTPWTWLLSGGGVERVQASGAVFGDPVGGVHPASEPGHQDRPPHLDAEPVHPPVGAFGPRGVAVQGDHRRRRCQGEHGSRLLRGDGDPTGRARCEPVSPSDIGRRGSDGERVQRPFDHHYRGAGVDRRQRRPVQRGRLLERRGPGGVAVLRRARGASGVPADDPGDPPRGVPDRDRGRPGRGLHRDPPVPPRAPAHAHVVVAAGAGSSLPLERRRPRRVAPWSSRWLALVIYIVTDGSTSTTIQGWLPAEAIRPA